MSLFNKNLFSPSLNAFGLDLSDLSLKIAQLKKEKGDLILANYGRQEIPNGTIEEGAIKKSDELIEIIKKGIRQVNGLPLNTRYCMVSLPETESFIRIIQMPKMKREELSEAIKWEIENHFPLSIEEVYFDWQIVSEPEDKTNILVGVMRKNLVDPYLNVIKKANLKPIAFEIESVATARSLIKDEFSAKPVLIIDVGARRTSLIIFFQNTVHFTASLSVSNEFLLEEVKKNLKTDKDEAKRLKFNIGLSQDKKGGRVYKALLPGLNELVEQVKKYINFYQTHGPTDSSDNKQFHQIILCGGGANLAGLPDFLTKELQIPTKIGNPWVNILGNKPEQIPELPYEYSIGYATALGLAIRGVREKDWCL